MDPSLDLPKEATCTTCAFTEDFSNYWTAVLYFRARNGTFKRVPQFPNQFLQPANGGITGFRMLVRDPARREDMNDGDARMLSFSCWKKNFDGKQGAPGAGCWDGKNLDSRDHKSHVAYVRYEQPSRASFESGGACPASHPVKIPQNLYEVAWGTRKFNDPNDWPEDGSQPSFSVVETLPATKAMGQFCFVIGPMLKTQTPRPQAANRCTIKSKIQEDIDSWLTELLAGPSVTFS
ncbi:uncharacterized protein EI97DRAFT_455989 [Westerdykella ornata]|uniref:DUF1996 domain-containing protein n=1 Tax=Westerdykella ornata TaxID=318751 RepID=A0A6A6JT94_WESOR|nr:uncharacterized protein EI97DRAFT_455989 [Westerdykella ornata]KAF2279792.1 hypothetical protein EI97DRAFT_455989 [Westerdykella ornata]